jgi:hypothetical protein
MNKNQQINVAIATDFQVKFQSIADEIKSGVDQSYGSLFTKDDVKNVIQMLVSQISEYQQFQLEQNTDYQRDEVAGVGLSKEKLKEYISEKSREFINDVNWNDFLEVQDTNFGIEYNNTIVLDDYEIGCQSHRDAVSTFEDAFLDDIDSLFETEDETTNDNC